MRTPQRLRTKDRNQTPTGQYTFQRKIKAQTKRRPQTAANTVNKPIRNPNHFLMEWRKQDCPR